jgi:hypothetical protein
MAALGWAVYAAWIGCGIITLVIDKRDYPEPVVPGADEVFRALMILGGPVVLAIILICRADIKSWKTKDRR